MLSVNLVGVIVREPACNSILYVTTKNIKVISVRVHLFMTCFTLPNQFSQTVLVPGGVRVHGGRLFQNIFFAFHGLIHCTTSVGLWGKSKILLSHVSILLEKLDIDLNHPVTQQKTPRENSWHSSTPYAPQISKLMLQAAPKLDSVRFCVMAFTSLCWLTVWYVK